jgi:hypothetical protein
MVNNFNREKFLEEFHQTGGKCKIHKQIPCTVTGKLVHMFGNNLDRRLKQYGSIEALLDNFVSREGKMRNNPKVAKEPKPRKETAPKKHRLLQRATKRARGIKKEAVEEAMAGTLKVPNRNYPPYDIKNQAHVEELTRTSCMRPDIFLDCGRICNFCPYNTYCIAPCKNMVSEQKAQKVIIKKSKK